MPDDIYSKCRSFRLSDEHLADNFGVDYFAWVQEVGLIIQRPSKMFVGILKITPKDARKIASWLNEVADIAEELESQGYVPQEAVKE